MIIGFDGSRAFSKNRTGTENYSYQILKNLAHLDKENIYKVFTRPGANIGLKFPSNFQIELIDFPRLWTQVGLALETFQTKLDVLFVPSHTLPLIKKPGLKTVVTMHDLGVEYLPKMHQIKQRLYLNWMTKFQLKSATKIIAVSNATKEDLIKKVGIDRSKIRVVYEGVDREVFKPIKGEVLRNSLKHYNLVPKSYFLFVGTIQPRKNLKRLIITYCRFISEFNSKSEQDLRIMNNDLRDKNLTRPSFRGKSSIINHKSQPKLVMAGGKGWFSDEIYELPKKLGIEDKVKFLGRVEDEDLPALYSGAIALTFPSLFEGFGLPVLEAFSCECSVITSNYSSTSEIASSAGYLVNPESEEEIADAMEFFLNKENREKFIKKGLSRVKLFTWEKCARQTLEVLKEAAGR